MARYSIQRFGKFLSEMIMPNISAIMAWGLVSALFIPDGWLPNKDLAELVEAMIMYLIPILVGSSGGKLTGGARGRIVATIATMGVIVATDIPMIIGAMIIGPLSGWVISKFDKTMEKRIPAGFELIINNFSAGILGILLAILGFYVISPIVESLTHIFAAGVNILLVKGLLPLSSIIIEPAKVMFLNNAINHGILGPIGIEQVRETGKSIMFLLEANPGPGLGVLLACYVFSKGTNRQITLGAMIISFFGGIHEIYFPYILRTPSLILAAIAGGAAGVLTGSIFNAGLVSAASPGSIFTLVALSPKEGIISTLLSVLLSTLVSLAVSIPLLEIARKKNRNTVIEINNPVEYEEPLVKKEINKIVFACDAGVGSSAMGATYFRKKLRAANVDITVTNSSVDNIPADVDLVVSHINLKERCEKNSPQAEHVFINDFLEDSKLDRLYESLTMKEINSDIKCDAVQHVEEVALDIENKDSLLIKENIVLGLSSESYEDAITRAGELLVKGGYVTGDYIGSMHRREKVYSTYIGRGVAIPHGLNEDRKEIIKSGVVILQYPNGVNFGAGLAYLVISVVGSEDEYVDILSHLASSLGDEELIQKLSKVDDKDEIIKFFKNTQ